MAGWGDLHVHADGFRGEKATIIALGWHESWPLTIRRMVHAIAKGYGALYVNVTHLAAAAAERGRRRRG